MENGIYSPNKTAQKDESFGYTVSTYVGYVDVAKAKGWGKGKMVSHLGSLTFYGVKLRFL